MKLVLILYLMCCSKMKTKGGDGVPRSLRVVVVSSLFHPLLLTVLPFTVFMDQLLTSTSLYQDELMLLFCDVLLENMNQLALGIVYMVSITQRGLSLSQMLLYPVQVLKLLFTFYTIVKGRKIKATSETDSVKSTSASRCPRWNCTSKERVYVTDGHVSQPPTVKKGPSASEPQG